MKKTISTLIVVFLTCSSAIFAQLPVWPLVTGFPQSGPTINTVGTTPHQFVDWTVGTPASNTIPGTASNKVGPTQAGINGCNELVFFTLHNGVFSAATAALEVYTPTGLYLPLAGGDMNASAGDDEIQVVRRPGYPNQWFVIYNLAPVAYPTSNPGYQACFLAYSLIEVNSTSASYVLDGLSNPIQDRIINVSGTNYQYFNGKAASRTSVVAGGDNDIYAQRRTQAFGSNAISSTFYIDRFTVSNSDAIIWTGSSSQVNGYSWGLMAAGSPIEFSPTENSLAVMARTQTSNQQQIYLFDPLSLATPPNTITISDLWIEFPTPPTPLPGLFHQANEFDSNPGTSFDWLKNFERKISNIEYSPNGNYLYLCGGGYSLGGRQNLTYLGQINLTQTISGDHPVRLQVQSANTLNTFNPSSGIGNQWSAANYTNLWEYHSISKIQSCYDGNLYFTKGYSSDLFVLPSPNSLLPINLAPSQLDFSSVLSPNIPMSGFVSFMPDQIDGFNYSISGYTSVSFNVSNQSLCTCEPIDIDVVNVLTGEIFTTLSITECPTVVTLCVEDGESYNLVGSNGVVFNNAIISGSNIYPVGTNMFNFGNGGAVGTTFTTVTVPLITSNEAWDGKYFIPDNMIVVVDNATLDLTNVDLVFGDCAGIDFINGAMLRANNSVLRPCEINGVWRGLDFYSGINSTLNPTAIINECTFKNAQRAINAYDQSEIDLRVTNNLFSNCKGGVILSSGTYVRSISGNTFLLDDLAPDFSGSTCSWGINQQMVGIGARNLGFLESITQNDFVAPDFTTTNFTGIFSTRNYNLSVNSNNFTNTYQSIAIDRDKSPKVESNEINVTHNFQGYEHQISVINSYQVLISDNDIVNSSQHELTSWAGNNSAIYCNLGQSYDIKENRIVGFETGIQVENTRNIHITDNEIENCYFYGIYMNNLRTVKTSCNSINMEFQNNGNAIGIGYYTSLNASGSNEISSNCIFETNTAMHLSGTNFAPSELPIILNNYMYNYSDYGVEVVNMLGNIGSSPSPALGAGRNSFVSNNGLGLTADIASTNPLTSFGNYGVSFVSGTISIAGNNVNSTATCGHQIDLANSSNGYMEICDDLSAGIIQLVFNGNTLNLSYAQAIPNASYPQLVHSLHLLVKSANPQDIDVFYDEAVLNGSMTESELNWFTYHYHILKKEDNEAMTLLSSIIPADAEEMNLISIEQIQLGANTMLDPTQVATLESIATSNSDYAHLATAVLYQYGETDERLFYPTRQAIHLEGVELLAVEETSFSVYPNPTSGEVSFEYSIGENEIASFVVFDITGKQVRSIDLDYQHSTQTIDLSALPNGMYTLSIQSDKHTLAHAKLIKL